MSANREAFMQWASEHGALGLHEPTAWAAWQAASSAERQSAAPKGPVACPCGIKPESSFLCSAGTCSTCQGWSSVVKAAAPPSESALRVALEQAEIGLANLVSYQSSGNTPNIYEFDQARRALIAVRAALSAAPEAPPKAE